MGTPDFVRELRTAIGTAPLWLSGVTAVVIRRNPDGDGDQVLLVRRADTGAWTPVTGIIDPGENAATAGAREVLEEAGVRATATRLAATSVTETITYGNGDQAQYLDLTFRFRWVAGDPYPADGENLAAQWFPVDDLPELSPTMRSRVDAALPARGEARFDR